VVVSDESETFRTSSSLAPSAPTSSSTESIVFEEQTVREVIITKEIFLLTWYRYLRQVEFNYRCSQ
jgi:hypothetical protein